MFIFLLFSLYFCKECITPFILHYYNEYTVVDSHVLYPNQVDDCLSFSDFSIPMFQKTLTNGEVGREGVFNETHNCHDHDIKHIEFLYLTTDEWTFKIHDVTFESHGSKHESCQIKVDNETFICEDIMETCQDILHCEFDFHYHYFSITFQSPNIVLYIDGIKKCLIYHPFYMTNRIEFGDDDHGLKFEDDTIFYLAAWDYPFDSQEVLYLYTTRSIEVCFETIMCNGIMANETSVCSSNGRCIRNDTCFCATGYHGNDCQYFDFDLMCPIHECNDVPSIKDNVCSSSGVCLKNSTCLCAVGYFGNNCQDFNESVVCTEKICDCPITCNNTCDCNDTVMCNSTCNCNDTVMCNSTCNCNDSTTCDLEFMFSNCSHNGYLLDEKCHCNNLWTGEICNQLKRPNYYALLYICSSIIVGSMFITIILSLFCMSDAKYGQINL